jgi:hypothetical protein
MAAKRINNGSVTLSTIKDRDFALRALVPCALWIVKRRGRLDAGFPGFSVRLPGEVVVCRSRIDLYRFAVSVYVPVCKKKVFSAHVTNRPELFDPAFYRNCEGHVGVVSWRRGEWEDVILEQCFASDSEGFWQVLREAEGLPLH